MQVAERGPLVLGFLVGAREPQAAAQAVAAIDAE